jgi:hypothetical protein
VPSGYSGTPLPFRATLRPLATGVQVETMDDGGEPFDVVLLFTKRRSELEALFPTLSKRLVSNGGLWIAWPKRASGVGTDLTEDVVRAIGLGAGLVDNKVCAVDETWSGLRFVIRLRDRPKSK